MNSKENQPPRYGGIVPAPSYRASDPSRKSIGARLLIIRGDDTQEEMSVRMGVYKNTYSRWERGEREPSATDLARLAQEGWNINWVLTGEGSKRLEPSNEANNAKSSLREPSDLDKESSSEEASLDPEFNTRRMQMAGPEDALEAGIGDRLRTIRSHRSQAEFAQELAVSTKTYGLWERSERSPDAITLIRLGMAGWNINWLLTGDGPERLNALKQSTSLPSSVQPEMLQKAVESAISVFHRMNKTPSAKELGRATVLLYMLFTDAEPDTNKPVDQLLARLVSQGG